jgi:hypothetical protein
MSSIPCVDTKANPSRGTKVLDPTKCHQTRWAIHTLGFGSEFPLFHFPFPSFPPELSGIVFYTICLLESKISRREEAIEKPLPGHQSKPEMHTFWPHRWPRGRRKIWAVLNPIKSIQSVQIYLFLLVRSWSVLRMRRKSVTLKNPQFDAGSLSVVASFLHIFYYNF